MKSFQVISDSSCDLSQEMIKKLDIEVIPFYVSFDSENYLKEGIDISIPDFYQEMIQKEDVFPKTSMPNIEEYMNIFEKYAKEEMPVMCICLNSDYSGSYQAAVNAKEEVKENYPNACIEIIDSTLATILQGMLVQNAVDLANEECPIEESIEKVKDTIETGRIFFTTNDLEYLANGGRIGKATMALGNVFNMKPLIKYENKGLIGNGICRGRKKSLKQIVEQLKKYIDENNIITDEYRFGIAVGADNKENEKFIETVKEKMKEHSNIDVFNLYHVGATIGVHTGPYPMGVALIKKTIN